MGDKIAAKKTMEKAGIHVIPGYHGIKQDNQSLIKEAKKIGFPLLVKAAAGGGGKGMRIVHNEDVLEESIESAKRESKSSFGDDTVFLERYLDKPRHIEFQILADEQGNIVHLFERECSIQRRHQKIIEESPSPVMTNKLRKQMGEAAVTAAKAVGYNNAGTVEFMIDEQMNYYFMEMNTRIQVEHPVTEMVTGLDLVKEQIRVAAGEPLSFPEGPIAHRGHAIEFRINAEDPARNFAPSPGQITVYHPPGGPGVRMDTHIYTGYHVPPFYDSLLGKLVVWGDTREEAIARAQHSLDACVIEGVSTTISFLSRIIRDSHFVSGKVDTGFVERFLATEGDQP